MLLISGAKDFQWEFVHGLLENAIYGGRIDNYFDMRVLRSYLEQFFNARVIADSNFRGKKMSRFPYSISLPSSCNILVSMLPTYQMIKLKLILFGFIKLVGYCCF